MKGCDSTAAPSSGVCDPCWRERHGQLRDLPELWLRLQNLLPKGSVRPADGLAAGSPGPTLPLQICVLDALRQIPLDLTGQANIALALRGQDPISLNGKRWSFLLSQSVHVLRAIDQIFYGQSEQLEYARVLAHCHRKALYLTGLDQHVVRLPAPCPSCGCHTLFRHFQRRLILCTRSICRGQWTEPRYADLIVSAVSQAT